MIRQNFLDPEKGTFLHSHLRCKSRDSFNDVSHESHNGYR